MNIVKVSLPAAGVALLLALGAGSLFSGRDGPPPAPPADDTEATIGTAVFAVG